MKLPHAAFSWRSDTDIAPLPDAKVIFVYDGVCVLCSGGARMVARADTHDRVRFVSGQSARGQALLIHYGLPATVFEEQLVLTADGQALTGFDGIAAVVRALPLGWMHLARLLPYLPFQHRIYRHVARNRYRLAGQRDACMIPPPELAERFLD